MADTAAVATANDEVVVPKGPTTRKAYAYDINMKCFFVQTIDTLISSGKSRRASCAFVGIPPLYYHRWRRLLAIRLTMSMPRKSLWPTSQKAQLVKFIAVVKVF